MPVVEVVKSPNCPRCEVLVKALEKLGVEYRVFDLSSVEDQTELVMRDIYIVSTPALIVDGVVYTSDQLFPSGDELNVELLRKAVGR